MASICSRHQWVKYPRKHSAVGNYALIHHTILQSWYNGQHSELELTNKDTYFLFNINKKSMCAAWPTQGHAGVTLAPACVQGLFFNSELKNVSDI